MGREGGRSIGTPLVTGCRRKLTNWEKVLRTTILRSRLVTSQMAWRCSTSRSANLERSQWAGVSPGSWLCSRTPTFMLLSFSTVHVEKTQHTQARVRQAATLHLTRRLCLRHALWIKRCPRWSNAREKSIVLRGECCTLKSDAYKSLHFFHLLFTVFILTLSHHSHTGP